MYEIFVFIFTKYYENSNFGPHAYPFLWSVNFNIYYDIYLYNLFFFMAENN